MIVAIDGPAASGKGTLAKRLAETLRLPHLDTGKLYRATARDVLAAGGALTDVAAAAAAAKALDPSSLEDHALSGKDMGEAASIVAAMPEVRAALFELQRMFAQSPIGAILDGRDIGTVICPEAPVKIFVTASPDARALRRLREFEARGERADYETVLADIRRRDARDTERSSGPLVAAEDAVLLDTTALDVEQSVAAALEIVQRRLDG